jgi:hypothetical protein
MTDFLNSSKKPLRPEKWYPTRTNQDFYDCELLTTNIKNASDVNTFTRRAICKMGQLSTEEIEAANALGRSITRALAPPSS